MKKIIDLDKMFDEYIKDYVYKNIGKIKPEEIEDNMPKMYEEFGNVKLKELDNMTPNTYYRDADAKELVALLKEHVEKDIDVSDFLCEALADVKDGDKAIYEELKKDNSEEFTLYLMNMLNDRNSDIAVDRYLEFVLLDYSEPIRELATELLHNFADKVKDKIVDAYDDADETKKECLCEILSYSSYDDRVLKILCDEFLSHSKKIPLYAGFLGKYGSDRALPLLLEKIEDPLINYQDFEELRFNIELLGGEYSKTRDFSCDKYYRKIKGVRHHSIV